MITAYTKTGSAHARDGIPCQDAVYFAENPKMLFIALADGVSECPNSHIGAQVACRAAGDYLLEYAQSLAAFSDQKLAYLILEQVVFALEEKAAELGCAPESLSSTLSFCCVNRKSRSMIAFHLGDGAVYTLEQENAALLIPPARDGLGGTVSTLTRNAYKAVQIRRASLPGQTRVLLCSDGVLKAASAPDCTDDLRQSLSLGDPEGLKAALDQAENFDDCSFIIC